MPSRVCRDRISPGIAMLRVKKKERVSRACNLSSFSPCLTGPVDYPFASRHKGPGLKSPGGVLMWNWDSPVSIVSLHWWPRRDWSLWPRLRWGLSRTVTRPSHQQCPDFTLAAEVEFTNFPPSRVYLDFLKAWLESRFQEVAIHQFRAKNATWVTLFTLSRVFQ